MRNGVEEYTNKKNGEDGDFFVLIKRLTVYPWLYLLLLLIFFPTPMKILNIPPPLMKPLLPF
jgi:hypothetical protein